VGYSTVDVEKDMSVPPVRHIIAELCASAKIEGQVALRPYFYLAAEEKIKGAWAEGMIAIQSGGLSAKLPMRNKQWFPERFQEVVNRLKNNFKFVQLGSTGDPPLAGVIDLRGKTSIRETAAVLANCRLYIGTVGFLMHLARAVECPAVIIFGGREAPWQSGYGCNINLYSAESCAPCWLWNKCDYNRICMDKIAANDVVHAIEQITSRARNPLKVDEYRLSSAAGEEMAVEMV
jgi:ADP-heptose:LPS heptosyltransferase